MTEPDPKCLLHGIELEYDDAEQWWFCPEKDCEYGVWDAGKWL